MKHLCALLVVLVISLVGCTQKPDSSTDGVNTGEDSPGPLVVYCGRSEALVKDVIAQFEKETGTEVTARYEPTANLVSTLRLEAKTTVRGDVFFAQDAGALGVLAKEGLLAKLDSSLVGLVPKGFSAGDGSWIGISGRARVLSYSSERVRDAELPQTVFELTDPKWKGRVGWPPANASFKAFITAMRKLHGEEKTLAWLKAMKANGTKEYPKNRPAIQAIADGEIDVALVNHYYLYAFYRDKGADFPVKNHFFGNGDVGGVINVAGVAILKASPRKKAAAEFVRFLAGETAQGHFGSKTFEYPLALAEKASSDIPKLDDLQQPDLDLSQLEDLEATIGLLRSAGIVP